MDYGDRGKYQCDSEEAATACENFDCSLCVTLREPTTNSNNNSSNNACFLNGDNVYEVTEGQIFTKGDHNATCDSGTVEVDGNLTSDTIVDVNGTKYTCKS